MLQTPIDERDRQILRVLQAEGRLSNVDLAERVALSPSPCFRRVKRLEEAGVIRGYCAQVDRAKVGRGLTVFVEIKVDRHTRANAEALAEALAGVPEVVSCHLVSGAADFLAEVVVPDVPAYERFLSDTLLVLPMIADIRSNFALRSIKAAAPVPV